MATTAQTIYALKSALIKRHKEVKALKADNKQLAETIQKIQAKAIELYGTQIELD